MRKFVFRSWLPDKAKMITHDEISLTEGKVYERIYYPDTGFMNSFKRENAVLMQYTGLSDQTGRAVFEGDIVIGKRSSHWHEGFDKVKGVVVYRNEIASFDIDSSSSKALTNGGSLHKTDELEIIGNVYQNPELLVSK